MKIKFKKYILGIIGAIVVGFAVAILTKAEFGLDAFSSFIGNLVQMTGRSFGLFNFIIGICFVTINTVINRKRYNFFAIVIAFVIGVSVDLFIPIVRGDKDVLLLYARMIWFVIGVLIYGFGVAILIKSSILSPLEEYMMAIKKIFHTTVAKSKFITDASLILFALIVGYFALGSFGQVGIGSVVITIFVGKVIDLFLKVFKKINIGEKRE